MIRFLANENFPAASYKLLKNKGWDIEHVGETNMGISDNEVINSAVEQDRVIITFDSDYGELVYKFGYKPPGVIYLRIQEFEPEYPGILLLDLIDDKNLAVKNLFTVIDDNQIRQRKI